MFFQFGVRGYILPRSVEFALIDRIERWASSDAAPVTLRISELDSLGGILDGVVLESAFLKRTFLASETPNMSERNSPTVINWSGVRRGPQNTGIRTIGSLNGRLKYRWQGRGLTDFNHRKNRSAQEVFSNLPSEG
jgi:hypothetical protein